MGRGEKGKQRPGRAGEEKNAEEWRGNGAGGEKLVGKWERAS